MQVTPTASDTSGGDPQATTEGSSWARSRAPSLENTKACLTLSPGGPQREGPPMCPPQEPARCRLPSYSDLRSTPKSVTCQAGPSSGRKQGLRLKAEGSTGTAGRAQRGSGTRACLLWAHVGRQDPVPMNLNFRVPSLPPGDSELGWGGALAYQGCRARLQSAPESGELGACTQPHPESRTGRCAVGPEVSTSHDHPKRLSEGCRDHILKNAGLQSRQSGQRPL